MTSERLAQKTHYSDVDRSSGMRGFSACCARTSAMASAEFRKQVPDAESHEMRWRIDGDPVVGQRPLNPRAPEHPNDFFERDEFVFEGADSPMWRFWWRQIPQRFQRFSEIDSFLARKGRNRLVLIVKIDADRKRTAE